MMSRSCRWALATEFDVTYRLHTSLACNEVSGGLTLGNERSPTHACLHHARGTATDNLIVPGKCAHHHASGSHHSFIPYGRTLQDRGAAAYPDAVAKADFGGRIDDVADAVANGVEVLIHDEDVPGEQATRAELNTLATEEIGAGIDDEVAAEHEFGAGEDGELRAAADGGAAAERDSAMVIPDGADLVVGEGEDAGHADLEHAGVERSFDDD